MVNFDRVARVYRLLEYVIFGGALQRARVRWFNALEQPQRALVIGEGDGRFLSELMRVIQSSRSTASRPAQE